MAAQEKNSSPSDRLNTSLREDRERRRTRQLVRGFSSGGLQKLPTWLVVSLTVLGALFILYVFYQWNLLEKAAKQKPTPPDVLQQQNQLPGG